MRRAKPTWRRVFDKIERSVGAPLEDVVASDRFMDVMSVGIRVRRAATGRVKGVVHGVTGGVLRAVNIPTRDDVRTLNNHLVGLAGELRALEQGQRQASARTEKRTGVPRARPVRAVDPPDDAAPDAAGD